MSDKEKIAKVKEELKGLRILERKIEALLGVKRRYEEYIKILESMERNDGTEESIRRTKRNVDAMNIEYFIAEETALKNKYIKALNSLDVIDSVIIIEAYINGKTYRKIGAEIGYTEDGIKKKMVKAIEKLALNVQ